MIDDDKETPEQKRKRLAIFNAGVKARRDADGAGIGHRGWQVIMPVEPSVHWRNGWMAGAV